MTAFEDPAVDAYVELRGLRFHYRDYAGPADRPPLVLLHGVASTSRIWLLVGPLLAEWRRVLALDQRGHGETEKPERGYDFASVVADALAFIDAIGLERPLLVGHSWGGNVAVQLAATHPERVAGLVLVDGGFLELSTRPGMTWERAERELAPPDMTHLTADELVEMAKQWELGPIWSPAVEAALLANFEVLSDGKIRPRLPRDRHLQVVRALWEQKVSELCPRVECPVLFVAADHGESERTRRWMDHKRDGVARAQERLRDCQVVWMPETIHDIPLHRPKELADLITRFAERVG